MVDKNTLEMIIAGSSLVGAFGLSKVLVYNLKYVRTARYLMNKEFRKAGLCHFAGHATSLITQAAIAYGAVYLAQKYPPLHKMYDHSLDNLKGMASYAPYFLADLMGKL